MHAVKSVPFLVASLLAPTLAHCAPALIAIGSISGTYEDLSSETVAPLENGVKGNLLGGIGSGFAYAGGTTFLALPDRGPNAVPYNAGMSDTVSYINRFHTFNMALSPAAAGSALPLVLTPTLRDTTLLSSVTPLVYGTGTAFGLPNGAPALNRQDHVFYFTGRADNFDPNQPSTNPRDARFDTESIRVSSDGRSVFISDEYGPYVYQFDRRTGVRVRAFNLPAELAANHLSANGDDEIAGNTTGRIANKGMEGLAVTPDGATLVGMMQANLEQDAVGSLRIVSIDVKSGHTRQFAYALTDGSGVSDILAVNDHQFLVDERDGKGLGDNSTAKVKKLYLIDTTGAFDVTGLTGDLSAHAVPKTLFLDVKAALQAAGFDPKDIPAKLEGIAFGQDVVVGGATKHTLYVTNDNDYLDHIVDTNHPAGIDNPNRFFVFAFDATDLPGFTPQHIKAGPLLQCTLDDDGNGN